MRTALGDEQSLLVTATRYTIHQTMLARNPPGPVALQIFFERLRFTRSKKGMPQTFLYERIQFHMCFWIAIAQREIIFPPGGLESQFHKGIIVSGST